jgi:hypothetical protein
MFWCFEERVVVFGRGSNRSKLVSFIGVLDILANQVRSNRRDHKKTRRSLLDSPPQQQRSFLEISVAVGFGYSTGQLRG